MPRLGKGGSLASRQAILHSLVHTESWAVDLAWDIIARFGSCEEYKLPIEFFNDFVKVLCYILTSLVLDRLCLKLQPKASVPTLGLAAPKCRLAHNRRKLLWDAYPPMAAWHSVVGRTSSRACLPTGGSGRSKAL